MATINSQLSKELKIPPLKPKEQVKFRLLRKGQIDQSTKEPLVLSDYWQVGKEMIYDPFAKKRVLILNVVGEKPVEMPDGRTRYEPIVGMIKWDEKGDIQMGEEQFEQICFMRRSNKNRSNKFRNKRRKVMFFEVNEMATLHKTLKNMDLTHDAYGWVRDCPLDELKAIANNLGVKFSEESNGLDSLRITLLKKCEELDGPRAIIIASSKGNARAKMKVQITDAEKYEILFFDDNTRDWYFMDNVKESIVNISVEQNKVDGLIDHFAKGDGGKGQYALLVKKVKHLYKAIEGIPEKV